MRLADKSIVVTGATGIAAAGAQALAAQGARVFVISLESDDCSSLASRIVASGGVAGWAAADLTDAPAAEAAFDQACDFLGDLDGVFAVAGGSGRRFGDGPIDAMSLEAWEQTLRVNGHPLFLATRETIRRMGDSGGSVVMVGSVLATHPVPGLFSTHGYAAAKGVVGALTLSLAAHYAQRSIRVNTIAPGLVDTPMATRAASDPDTVAYVNAKQPLSGGLIDPLEVASAAVFLLSDESAAITGQVIAVDGGWSVTEV